MKAIIFLMVTFMAAAAQADVKPFFVIGGSAQVSKVDCFVV